MVNVTFKPLTLQISPSNIKQILNISKGFQLIADKKSTQKTAAQTGVVPSKIEPDHQQSEQAIPKDLIAKLSGRETDVDIVVGVVIESIGIAMFVDSKKVLNAAIAGVTIDLIRRTYDTSIAFGIHFVLIEECLSDIRLIQSHVTIAQEASDDKLSQHFINIQYFQQDRTSPSFKEIDHDLFLHVGLLEVNFEPTSLYETALFAVCIML